MSEFEPHTDEVEPPDVASWLEAFLGVRRAEYEQQYGTAPMDDATLERALESFRSHALRVVSTGVVPTTLRESLGAFMPGDADETKLIELLSYRIVHHRLEFDVAEDVCVRLSGLSQRIATVTVLQVLLLGHGASDTAVKYFERATTLYLAGYEAETVIMCGAVLEAAFKARFPDEKLGSAGLRPVYGRAGFRIKQRRDYEKNVESVLTPGQRSAVGELTDWRDNAVHAQPDIGPPPVQALINLAAVLPALTGTALE